MAFRDLDEIGAMFASLAGAFDRYAEWSYSSRPYQRTFVWHKRANPPSERERVTEAHTRARRAAWMRGHYDADKRRARWDGLKADPAAHAEHLARRRAAHASLDETARAQRREREAARRQTPERKAAQKAADARYYQRKRAANGFAPRRAALRKG
jgi:hypothetical protein